MKRPDDASVGVASDRTQLLPGYEVRPLAAEQVVLRHCGFIRTNTGTDPGDFAGASRAFRS